MDGRPAGASQLAWRTLRPGSHFAASAIDATSVFDETGDGYHRRRLRIALAMKGGVSLAVWIGGAVAELDVLRRIRIIEGSPEPDGGRGRPRAAYYGGDDPEELERARRYAELLDRHGYDRVEIDVLAGASAGGLNAVLFGVAQLGGSTMDGVFDLWERAGAVWDLLRPSGTTRIDSVLDGDGFFWKAARDALESIRAEQSVPDSVRPTRLTIDLSATMLETAGESERGTREGRAHFHFVGGSQTGDAERERRRIPLPSASTEDPDGVDDDLDRLAYAARSTSSFPGAFEPAKIYSTAPLRVPADARLSGIPGPAHPLDFSRAFHAHRELRPSYQHPRLDPFRVVDGGATDNVPIDRAMRTVLDRVADGAVTRMLVYLDPSPKPDLAGLRPPARYDGLPPIRPGNGAPPTSADPKSALFGTVLTSLGRMFGRESKDEEVDEVDRLRRRLATERMREAPLGVLLARGRPDPDDLGAAYLRTRATADAQQFAELLAEPSRWQLTARIRGRRRIAPWDRSGLLALERVFHTSYATAEPWQRAAIRLGPQARVDACRTLLAWIRAIEGAAERSPGGIPGLDDRVAAGLRASLRDELGRRMSLALAERDGALFDAVAGCTAPDPAALAAEWLRRNVGVEWDPAYDRLVAGLRELSDAVAESGAESWEATPWAALRRLESAAPDLAPTIAVRGIPLNLASLRYDEITAEETDIALARAVPGVDAAALRERQARRGFRALLGLPHADLLDLASPGPQRVVPYVARVVETERLLPTTKLGGASLANFAGFLSRDWRSDDWWWGRLDAAAGIVRILDGLGAGDGSASAAADEGSRFAQRVAVQTSLVRQRAGSVPAAGPADGSAATPAVRQPDLGDEERAGLPALDAGYRVAVLSRLVRLLPLALERGAFARAVVWVLRPALAVVPAVADPPRLAVVAALAVAPIVVLAPPAGAGLDLVAATAQLLLCALALGIAAAAVGRTRSQREAVLKTLDPERQYLVGPVSTGAGWIAAPAAATALLVALDALHAWSILPLLDRLPPALPWLLAILVVVLAALPGLRANRPRVRHARGRWRRWGYALAGAILGAAGVLGSIGLPSAPWLPAAAGGLLGLAAALALTLGWLTGRAPNAPRVARIGIGVLLETCLVAALAAAAPLALWEAAPEWRGWLVVGAIWLWGTALWWLPQLFPWPSGDLRYRPDDSARAPEFRPR
ncbi:DUF3376 domain-containing protein [Agromyces seonyuensis]|uniref:DUF3376 domain-containing protein n=1 Tax=Agromyces seonyuensis TaxID=2662446 RepID=A0A6I4NUV1_9MICO|nr:DUF3376 domain-containing protein [Agromyces seonyuensis]MWB98013.1 DUF3376 domain-containing protein [Agromyces seonyuensis]